jgi:histidinol-phosphate aminotransferase
MKVSAEILNLVPYKPGKPISETQREYGIQDVIKLASNENPLGVSPRALSAIRESLDSLHVYPDAAAYSLVHKISEIWNLPVPQIAIGNGSNELIDLLIRIFCEPGDGILITEASFVAYRVCGQAARAKIHRVPMAPGFRVNLFAMGEYLQNNALKDKIRLVFIPNPNNPTGTYVTSREIDDFLKIADQFPDLLVVFDEAYTEYARAQDYRSSQKLLMHNEKIAVIRTMSKAYGMAGLRVGILLSSPFVIDLVNRVRNPFNVNELAQVAAVAAIDDYEFIQKSVRLAHQGLDYFYAELKKMALPFIESQGNFLMFDTLKDVKKVNESLLKRGVILRPISNYGFMTQFRMSTGLQSENERAIAALKQVLPEV